MGRGREGRGHQDGVNLKQLHVGFYGAVMGLAGLGLTARAAASLFPGTIRAPAYFTEPWVAAGAIALAVLVVLYVLKGLRSPGAVREDFTTPLHLGFCGGLPVGMSLVAGGVGAYFPQLGHVLWWTSFAMRIAFRLGAAALAQRRHRARQGEPGWLIIRVGGIVLPGRASRSGTTKLRVSCSASRAPARRCSCRWFYRALAGPPLPRGLRPTGSSCWCRRR